MHFTLRQLGYIHAAAQHKSIAAAAKSLSISQSSVAAAIDSFEASFSVSLFVRLPSKGMTITPQGAQVIERISHLLHEAESFDSALSGMTRGISGELVLGCFAPFAPHILPYVIRDLTTRYSNLRIRVLDGDLHYVNNLLDQGDAEVILSYDLGLPPGISFERLYRARPQAIFSENDPLALNPSVTMAELASKPMILLDLPESRTYFEMIFKAVNLTPNIVFRTGNYESVRSFVAAGLGYSILNMRPSSDITYSGTKIVWRRIEDAIPAPTIGIGLRPQDYHSPAVKAFAEECRKFFGQSRSIPDTPPFTDFS